MSHFFPSHEPFFILYLVLHFLEVWKCGIVWQSQDNVTLFLLSKYAKMTRKMNRGHFVFFMIYVQHLHNLREEEKLRNSGYMAWSNNDQSWSILIRKKDWLEIGFLNFKFLSTAGIETMVISSIQNINSATTTKIFVFVPSFFSINLFYMFKIIQIAKNWNDTCVRGLEISHWKVLTPRTYHHVIYALWRKASTKKFAFAKSLWVKSLL